MNKAVSHSLVFLCIVFGMLDLSLFGWSGTRQVAAQDSPKQDLSKQDLPKQDLPIEPAIRHLLLVVGVDGTQVFGSMFKQWTEQWQVAAASAGLRVTTIDGSDKDDSSLQLIESQIREAGDSVDELWIVLIGHGTFDGNQPKFNLVGDDVTAEQMAEWLKPREKPTVIINCASCSAPFIDVLSGPNRIVVTSTKSGFEMSFCYFGQHLADVISDPNVDLDKDQQTSLLEAVIVASGKTAEFYQADSRLASEHALIDDNADGRGTPVEWFRGVRITRQAKDGTEPDGLRSNQIFFSRQGVDAQLPEDLIEKRNQLESQIEQLRTRRGQLTEDQYYLQLEELMIELANLYRSAPSDQ